jgi:hypothetical protein
MGSAGDSNDSFARSLQDLKRRGSNLLVVGSPAEEARVAATRRLLGDGVSETRRRLFVFTDATHTDARIGQGTVSPETVRAIDRTTQTRTTAATASGMSTPNRFARRQVETTELGSLAWCIEEEIATFDDYAGGLASGELRLCFDSLAPLISEYDVETVRRFVGAVGNRVCAVSGMAHYHLPVSRSEPIVDELTPVFDAVIQLRVRDGLPEHRWELCDTALESTWIPL